MLMLTIIFDDGIAGFMRFSDGIAESIIPFDIIFHFRQLVYYIVGASGQWLVEAIDFVFFVKEVSENSFVVLV